MAVKTLFWTHGHNHGITDQQTSGQREFEIVFSLRYITERLLNKNVHPWPCWLNFSHRITNGKTPSCSVEHLDRLEQVLHPFCHM